MHLKLKWLLGIPAAAVLAVLLIGGYVRSQAENNGTNFNISGKVLISYSGTDATVSVPEGIEVIGREAFASNPYITTVNIPESVTEIEYGAFADCHALRQVNLPNSLTAVGDSAFNHCENLSSVTIGAELRTLGSGAFGGCSSLKEIRFPSGSSYFACVDGVLYDAAQKKIYQYLAGRTKRQYRMPDTVEDIARYAFWGCDHLEDITFSTGLSRIPDYALADAGSIETVTINAPLNVIGLKAFEGCSSLKQIVFPMSVSNIHETAFDNCNTNALFVCNAGSYVEDYALTHGFETNQSARYQVSYFEEEPKTPDGNAAANINKTENTEEANSSSEQAGNNTTAVTQEDYSVLLGNAKIVSDRVFVMAGNMVVTDGSTLGTHTENVVLPAIDDYAYYNQESLTSFDFSETGPVEVVGKLAFARTDLRSIVLPEGLRTVSYGAFYHCDQLAEVVIPSSVTNVEAYAFEYTPWLENWRNSEGTGDFLVVGDGVLICYKGSDTEIVIPENVKYIASGVFRDHHELTSVTFPAGLVSISSYAFSGCEQLRDKIGLSGNVYQDSTAFQIP